MKLSAILLAALLPLGAPTAAQPKALVIGTASAGGTVFIYGGVIAALLTEKLGVTVSTQQTQGPNQNIVLVNDKTIELGFTTLGAAWQGWNGSAEWTQGRKHRDFRALFPMYDAPFHFITMSKSGLTSLKDLAGTKLGLGPRNGSAGTYVPLMFRSLGFEATYRFGQASDMASQLSDGLLEAFGFVAGIPVAAFSELDKQKDVTFITFSAAELAKLKAEFPELSETVIPKGTYRALAEDHRTLGNYSFAIAHKDLPAELGYRVVKEVLENNERLVKGHAAARETVLANWSKNGILPYHAGAVRYFAEKGVAVPEKLR